jgi:hypothetical protein
MTDDWTDLKDRAAAISDLSCIGTTVHPRVELRVRALADLLYEVLERLED